MDWSVIYEDTGAEEGNWSGVFTRAERSASFFVESHNYSFGVAFAFTVNYVLGVGALGIPFAISRAGLILGSFCLIFVSCVSLITVIWVVEACARADATGKGKSGARIHLLSPTQTLEPDHKFELTGARHEVTELCEIFLGSCGKIAYQVCLCGLMFIGLWSYSNVFASSMQAQFPLFLGNSTSSSQYIDCTILFSACGGAFAVYSLLFAVIVVPLSFFETTEQVGIQVAMFCLRLVSLSLMILGAGVAMFTDQVDRPGVVASASGNVSYPYIFEPNLASFDGFSIIFPTALFSQLFQHSVPGLVRPLSQEHRRSIPVLFSSVLAFTCVIYLILAFACVLYFGGNVKPSVNLNWQSFTWGAGGGGVATPWWAKGLSLLVVLFPALDTLSVFPLIAITLGNSIASSLPSCFSSTKLRSTTGRILAAFPPVILSLLSRNLSVALQMAGLCGVYVALVTPALLQFYSARACEKKFGVGIFHTVYCPAFLGSIPAVLFVLVLAVCAFFTVVTQMLFSAS
jgi:amino acid permease